MLFRNDEKYTLTKEDFKKMAEFIGCSYEGTKFVNFPKGGVVVKYPKTAFTHNPDNPKRPDKPPFLIIPYEQELETQNGTEKWNYCKRPPTFKPGETPQYYKDGDAAKMFSHRFSINEDQPDLLFFLSCISQRGSHIKNVSRAAFEIENKKKEAQLETNRRMHKIEVEAAIFHPEKRMSEADIARIATAMRVPNVNGLDDVEIRHELIKTIEAMESGPERNGYKTFMEFTERGDVQKKVDMLAVIQEAKDMGLIKFFTLSHKWAIVNKEGKKIQHLCGLAPGKEKDESLEHYAIADPDVGEVLAGLVKNMKKKLEEEASA